MNDRYSWRGGTEMLVRHGIGAPLTLLVLPGLFEEANRMRHFTVTLMRALESAGVGTVLPDLPGTGESLLHLSTVTLQDWLDAVEAVAAGLSRPLLTVALRGGAVLDGGADWGWRLAPETGDRMARDLVRATAISLDKSATEIDRRARSAPLRLAGHAVSPAFYTSLIAATTRTSQRRTVRLADEAGTRDATVAGRKLWRAAEPGSDPELVAACAGDIVAWARACVQ